MKNAGCNYKSNIVSNENRKFGENIKKQLEELGHSEVNIICGRRGIHVDYLMKNLNIYVHKFICYS